MIRGPFTDTGDSRWGDLHEPKKESIFPSLVGTILLASVGVGPGIYIGMQKTEQEWQERRLESVLPPGRILSTQVTLTGKMKVEMLLSGGSTKFECQIRRDTPIKCTPQK